MNYLFNPAHPGAAEFRIVAAIGYPFDLRLKKCGNQKIALIEVCCSIKQIGVEVRGIPHLPTAGKIWGALWSLRMVRCTEWTSKPAPIHFVLGKDRVPVPAAAATFSIADSANAVITAYPAALGTS